MGTRNLICVVKDEQYRVAQYCQWDGYPPGQGKTAFNFLTEQMNEKLFREQLDKVKHLSPEEVKACWEGFGAKGQLVPLAICDRFAAALPHLERGFGANILNYVQTTPNPEVSLQLEFAGDSLFCEWAYVVDMDRRTLEVYRGFNKKPLGAHARFKFLEKYRQEKGGERPNPYFPISRISSNSFEDCRAMSVEKWTDEQEAIQKRIYDEEAAQDAIS